MHRHFTAMLSILLLCTAGPLAAQGFRIGGGINLTDFFGDDIGETDRKSGLDLGLSMPLLRMGPVQLRAEGYYRQKGAKSVEEFQQAALAGESVDIGIDYVEVPVLLRIALPSVGRQLFPYLQGGPAFAWRIDCGLSFDAGSSASRTSCDDLNGQNLENTLKDFEQGLVLGGGIDIPIFSIGSLNLDARYTHGLSRLANEGEIRNRALSVMLGYSFGLPYAFAGGRGAGGLPRS
jgi:hypothetical protein